MKTKRALEVKSNSSLAFKCQLCGLPLGPFPVQEKLEEEIQFFCCYGCRQVFYILSSLPGGLPDDFKNTDLYRISLASGLIGEMDQSTTGAPSEIPGSGCNEPKEAESELVKELVLRLEGMWCSACAWLIEQVLIRLPGVQKVKVLFSADLIRINYLPHKTPPEKIQEALLQLGYRALPLQDIESGRQERKRTQLRLGLSSLLAAHVMMISLVIYGGFFHDLGIEAIRYLSYSLLILTTPVMIYGGFPLFKKALVSLRHGHPSMEMLIAISALAAYGYSLYRMSQGSLHLYFDTASMLIVLVLLGKYLEAQALERIAGGLTEIYLLAHQKVRLLAEKGEKWQAADDLQPGDEIKLLAGETLPVDGLVISGLADVDESALTGESRPVKKGLEDEIRAGSLLLHGELGIRITRVGNQSSIGRILSLIQEGLSGKTAIEALADRLARWVIPAMLLLALGTAVYLIHQGRELEEALLRALTILVIACPCALGLAAPIAKVASVGIGRTKRFLIRDPAALEKLNHLDVLIFDKTGTLTKGRYRLREWTCFCRKEDETFQRIASIEALSDHYLAREIVSQASEWGLPPKRVQQFQDLGGMGVLGIVDGLELFIGNRELMQTFGNDISQIPERQIRELEEMGQTVVFFGWSGNVQGFLSFGDRLKPNAKATLDALKRKGLEIWLISGDGPATTKAVAGQLAVSKVIGQALPQDKVRIIREFQQKGLRVGMVGDGLNDAAALAQADVGIALGLRGGTISEVSDITLFTDGPEKVLEVLTLASRTSAIIRQNLTLAFIYNALAIPLAVMGLINPLIAALAMFASSLMVVGNTLRLFREGKKDAGTDRDNSSFLAQDV
jgi:heavy metal translocating P-type ATPase